MSSLLGLLRGLLPLPIRRRVFWAYVLAGAGIVGVSVWAEGQWQADELLVALLAAGLVMLLLATLGRLRAVSARWVWSLLCLIALALSAAAYIAPLHASASGLLWAFPAVAAALCLAPDSPVFRAAAQVSRQASGPTVLSLGRGPAMGNAFRIGFPVALVAIPFLLAFFESRLN